METGLDLLWFPTLYFYETGYSLHTLRQANRRSWRIGQHLGVGVKFFIYALSTQMTCLRLMGRKTLVGLMMEGKFWGEGIHSMDAEDDMMDPWHESWSRKAELASRRCGLGRGKTPSDRFLCR